MHLRILLAGAVAAPLMLSPALAANQREKAERLVAVAAETTTYFAEDKAFEPLWETADNAKAMVIIPRAIRAGFLLGGASGNAVMVARTDDGGWSQPIFFNVSAVSFGFQAGAEASETILLVMTQRGMEHLLSSTVKLGGDVSLAAGPVGGGAKAQTTDVLAFSRSRGLYGGVSLEGAFLKVRHHWNDAYYGADVSSADIIYRGAAHNPRSALLQTSVAALAGADNPALRLAPAQPATPYRAPGAQTPQTLTPPPAEYEDDAVWGEKPGSGR